MRKTVLAAVMLLCAGRANAQIDKFTYHPDRIKDVGTVYHYVKTNIDGTHPEWISIRIASTDRIQSFKFHPGDPPAALVTADMDWSNFSVKSLESLHVMGDGTRKTMATLKYESAEKAVYVTLPGLGRAAPEKTDITALPWHVYNFDFASLNFAFRHLKDKNGRFTIGVADPSFKQEGPAFVYRGEVELAHVGQQPRDGVGCLRYSVNGPGLQNRGGTIWVNQKGGYIQDMEIDLPDNPDWQSFKFKLLKAEPMTEDAWNAFMMKQLQAK